jgi:hypothetical protein
VSRFVGLLKHWTGQGIIRAAVLWYDAGHPKVEWGAAGKFAALQPVYSSHNARTVHYWWNSACRSAGARPGAFDVWPFSWGPGPWRYQVTAVPYDPVQLANLMYPDKVWSAAAPETPKVADDERVRREEAAERRREKWEADRERREEARERAGQRGQAVAPDAARFETDVPNDDRYPFDMRGLPDADPDDLDAPSE